MAGFLGALSFMAPVGQTLGPAMQQGTREAQADQRRQAFGKVLDDLPGSEWEPFRQWFKAGGQEHEIIAGIGGPIGARLQQQHETDLTRQIMSDPTLTTPQRFQKLFENKIISGPDFLKTQLPEKPVGNFEGWALDTQHLTPTELRSLPQDKADALYDKYKKDTAKTPGGIEWKQQYDKTTGDMSWVAYPKDAAPGTVGGLAAPRTAGGAQADLATARAGMQQLMPMLNKLPGGSNSDTPMWGAWLKTKFGRAINPEMAQVRGQMSVIHATLVGMVMRSWGSRNSAAAEKYVDVHVPNFGDSPLAIKQKLNEWMRPGGLLEQYQGMTGQLTAEQLQRLGVPPDQISQTLATSPNDAATITDPYANPPGGEAPAGGGGGGEAGDFIDEHFGGDESP